MVSRLIGYRTNFLFLCFRYIFQNSHRISLSFLTSKTSAWRVMPHFRRFKSISTIILPPFGYRIFRWQFAISGRGLRCDVYKTFFDEFFKAGFKALTGYPIKIFCLFIGEYYFTVILYISIAVKPIVVRRPHNYPSLHKLDQDRTSHM